MPRKPNPNKTTEMTAERREYLRNYYQENKARIKKTAHEWLKKQRATDEYKDKMMELRLEASLARARVNWFKLELE